MIELVRPKEELVKSYMEFVQARKRVGEDIWEEITQLDETPEQFIERLNKFETHPREDRVPETFYWALLDNIIVGRVSLRHELNDNLKNYGGHIGYEVHPDYRGKGIATMMLKLVLQSSKAKEIGKLLLTCDPNNQGSVKTITRNEGILEKTQFVENWERETSYYWIEV